MTHWAILAGEYPPQSGGVSDYTRQLARGLAAAGDEVHVWTSECREATPEENGVTVHRLPNHFGPGGLLQLDRDLKKRSDFDRLLVQYVPHSFGWKAMNLPLCLWLRAQRRLPVWVMFHEVAFPVQSGQRWKHKLLGRVTRLMARQLLRAAERVFVSIPAWEPLLRDISPKCPPITWLPVPSNIPTHVEPAAVAQVRRRIAPAEGTLVIGHFGTYGALITPMLEAVLPPLLAADDRRVALLVGRGGAEFARRMAENYPSLRGRLIAPGELPPEQLACYLSACDIMIQPYPDGASTRRTSLMTCLALGLPVVTTEGSLSEPLWRESGAVGLVPSGEPGKNIERVGELLGTIQLRKELGQRGKDLYEDMFKGDKAIQALRRGPGN